MSPLPSSLEGVVTAEEFETKIVFLVGVWLEALLYGIYLCLFLTTVPLLVQRNALRSYPAKVFLTGNLLMFIIITLHSCISIAFLVAAFAYQTDPKSPVVFFNNLTDWRALSGPILSGCTYWIGDFLVIYRCFLIWSQNRWVVLLPTLMAIASACTHIANLQWAHVVPGEVGIFGECPLITVPYTLYLAQNVLTTGLILWKLRPPHFRGSCKVALVSLCTPSLDAIRRILVESALIYTVGMLAMVICLSLDLLARYTVYTTLVPITGIVFILMARRLRAVCDRVRAVPATPSAMPTRLVRVQTESSLKVDGEDESSDSGETQRPPPILISAARMSVDIADTGFREGKLAADRDLEASLHTREDDKSSVIKEEKA